MMNKTIMYLKNVCLQVSDGCREKKMSERCMAKNRLDLPFIYIPLILMNEISIKSQKRRRKKIKKNQIKK